MSDKGTIVVGSVIFLGVVTFPFWFTQAAGDSTAAAAPEVELPADMTRCVEDKPFMTAHHMELLNQWRDAVVRQGQNEYISQAFGTHYEMSLTKTCLRCHRNRETFCNRCHTYADVEPRCWNCHVEPKGN